MHIMIDLETLGTRPGCAIASIGAVAFDPNLGAVTETFYAAIDLDSCERAGLKAEIGTVGWWLRQGDAARAALFENTEPLGHALERFALWFRRQGGREVWAHGATFDPPILAAACEALGRPVPWRYPDVRDTRTLYALAGVQPRRDPATHHNALADAQAQAAAVIEAYAKLARAETPAASAVEPAP